MPDYPKKYWWLVLVVLPIALAIVGIIPALVRKESPGKKDDSAASAPTSGQAGVQTGAAATSTQTSSGRSPVPGRKPEAEAVKPDPTVSSTAPQREIPDVIQASGIGLAPDNVQNPAQRTAMARRAAQVDAMRNLTEAIRGAIVKSETKTSGAQLTEDVIQVKVSAVLKLAHTIGETVNPDGSVKVTMEAPVHQ